MRSSTSRGLATGPALLCLCLLAASCAATRALPEAPGAAPVVAAPQPSPTAGSPAPDGDGTPQRNVVLIGDSTTYGTPPPRPGSKSIQSPYNPGATLEALLATLEPPPAEGGTPWRDARVHNLAVGASTTTLWLQTPPVGCGSVLEVFPVVKAACATQVAWIDAIPAAIGGVQIDAVIIDLGINDLLITKDPAETVRRLKRIRAALAPAPVIFYPPIAPRDGPRGDWPQRVRKEMAAQGLFDEAQYPPYVPTFDGLHPTHGGYAAMGGLWLDGLRRLP